ncbi:UvrD/REP helicase [Hyphomicrobium denitrificans ATCC 51888]|uniref:DNA 3'-5' helicase n=1 Tax=Hyphomicrobium denitrificans (strain ATCC 51888 / DSM 1869 / NCIMB 11706 / TK 0415) TaxID=582899 RepID=D8JQT1_HYPDA|nr:UvrD-helicase domain-containing protein [Hyphomicrobium denitrificans]ADJ22083.1 UvrD/REP helicase [Hyphomicrobium denitrificans ATCC 51888]
MTSTRKPNAGDGPDFPADDDPPFDLPQAPASANAPARPDNRTEEIQSISARAIRAARGAPTYLDGLNPEQREAVETTEGPLLVLAGAGTGKTRVLTTRIAHILATGKAYPSQILAVTFTNKAAREMRDRIGGLIGGTLEGMSWLGTFHSIGVKILRRHAELVGLKSGFTILDDDDQVRLLKQVIEAARLDKDRWPARQLAGLIDSWKNRGLTPDKVPDGESFSFAAGKGAALYAAYQARLKDLNACDFGDLLLECIRLFREHPDVLADYHRRFRYILVDEYQDTNVAQYLWLRLLAQGCPNVCCVGDDDQSIYGWRGAEVDNILRFEKDFPGAKVIRLERNYRSTANILAAASGLIAKNAGRLGKTLFTDGSAGSKIGVANFWDDEAEARAIGEDIEQFQRAQEKLNDIAVLVRASSQMRAIEDRFITLGLPYRVIGGPRFYERQEIKDAIAYFDVIANSSNDLKFERIVNVPKRGLGDTSIKRIHELARVQGVPLYQAAREIVETDELSNKARKSLGDLMQAFERWRGNLDRIRHTDLAELVLDESGYTAMWQADKSPQAQTRLENLKELVRFMHDFETLQGFLEHVSLVMDADQGSDGDRVSLMTLHAAKGLEFGIVFLPGWEEGLFPHQRSLDESGKAGLEEERRLAYVGLTRARRRAKISFAQNRRTHGLYQSALPSRFVDELPEATVDVIESEMPYGGRATYGYGNPFGPSRFDRASGSEPFGSNYKTPGWQRAQQSWSSGRDTKKRARTPITLEGELVAASTANAPNFRNGSRVRHEKFGDGTVTLVDGNKLTINFDDGSTKRVVASFVDLI